MESIPLKKWIDGALDSVDLSSCKPTESPWASTFGPDTSKWPLAAKRAVANLSDSFLFPALRVALSITHQICQAEKFNSYSELIGGQGAVPFAYELPATGTDWSNHIVVVLGPASTQSGSVKSGTQTVTLAGDFREKEEKSDYVNADGVFSYQDVQRSNILPSVNANGVGRLDDEYGRLHSLGLVFYELFSGGQKPSESTFLQDYPADHLDPLSLNEQSSIDANSALHILDNLCCNDETNEDCQPLPLDRQIDIDAETALHFLGDFGTCGEGDRNVNDGAKRSRPSHSKPQKKVGHEKSTISLSVEPLKVQGLPIALCDLIFNMIDCANGIFRSNESYSSMADVLTDLNLMLEKPEKFLHDLDMRAATTVGLKIDESLNIRNAEFSTLLRSYKRSIAGDNEIAIISGPSGTGKSTLAMCLASAITKDDNIFVSGKFDQHNQNVPFSAIATAFNRLCDILTLRSNPLLSSALKLALGQDIIHLINVIPNLSKLLGHNHGFSVSQTQNDCVDAQKRLQHLLCQFLKVVLSVSSHHITLFVDDLQWADPASVLVLNHLLLDLGPTHHENRLFFVGCCRDDEVSEGHAALKMVSGLENFDVKVTKISLKCLDKEVLNTMLSNLLCRSPRVTRPLSEIIYQKTKGSPLFYSQLITSMCQEGELRLNLARRLWDWDEEKIQSRKLPDDVASFFTSMIHKLTRDVQTAMSTMACFGASVDCSVLEKLETKLELQLVSPLNIAVAEGFLEKEDGKYLFSHDRVQEVCFNMLDPLIRQSKHLEYGLALLQDFYQMGHCPHLFTCVGQLNRGGPSLITDSNQGATIASLNLMAGNRAIEMSDFSTALHFFDNGISFLKKKHWKEHYDLSLSLFDKAAECALANADFESLKILSDQVMKNALSVNDKLNMRFVLVCSMAHTSNPQILVETTIPVLQDLGVVIPANFQPSEFFHQMERVASMLCSKSDDDLLNFDRMTDSSKIMAMKFLFKLQKSFMMLNDDRMPFIILQMVQLTLVHGISNVSPLAYGYYGSLLGKLGNIDEGYRFAKIAMSLADKLGSKEVAGEVYCVTTLLRFAVEPMQSANEFLFQGHKVALSVGDMDQAALNLNLHTICQFWIGTELPVVKKNISSVWNFMRKNNHMAWAYKLEQLERAVSECIYGAGTYVGNDASPEASQENEMLLHFHHMFVCFMYRKYRVKGGGGVEYFAEKYFECKREKPVLFVFDGCLSFIDFLVSFNLFRLSRNNIWAERGKQSLAVVRRWANTAKWSFEHKCALLEAEENFCNNNTQSAESMYEKAIDYARRHKFINEEAIAYEMAAYFFLDIGKKEKSLDFFTKAHEKYHEWGALAKASDLHNFVLKMFDAGVGRAVSMN